MPTMRLDFVINHERLARRWRAWVVIVTANQSRFAEATLFAVEGNDRSCTTTEDRVCVRDVAGGRVDVGIARVV